METLDPKVTKAVKEKIGFTDMLEESREKATGPQRTTGGLLELGAEIPGPATPYFLVKAFPKIAKEIRNLVGTAASAEKVNKELEKRLAGENVDQTRRDILLAVGSGGAVALLKFLGLDKLIPATKVAKAAPEIITKGGTPKYFFDFVNLIKTKGNDITDKASTIERQKVYEYEGYLLEQDMTTGGVRISKETHGGASYPIGDGEYEIVEGIIRKEEIGYSPAETIIGKDGKPVKVPDMYEEYTLKPDDYGKEGDFDSGLESIDEILELFRLLTITLEFGSSLPRNFAQADEISLVSIPVEITPSLYCLEILLISMILYVSCKIAQLYFIGYINTWFSIT